MHSALQTQSISLFSPKCLPYVKMQFLLHLFITSFFLFQRLSEFSNSFPILALRYMGIDINDCAVMLVPHNTLDHLGLHPRLKTTAAEGMPDRMRIHIIKIVRLPLLLY